MMWQPMTEDVVFEDGCEYLVAFHHFQGYIRKEKMIYEGHSFWHNDDEYDRESFTHFCMIVDPTIKKQQLNNVNPFGKNPTFLNGVIQSLTSTQIKVLNNKENRNG